MLGIILPPCKHTRRPDIELPLPNLCMFAFGGINFSGCRKTASSGNFPIPEGIYCPTKQTCLIALTCPLSLLEQTGNKMQFLNTGTNRGEKEEEKRDAQKEKKKKKKENKEDRRRNSTTIFKAVRSIWSTVDRWFAAARTMIEQNYPFMFIYLDPPFSFSLNLFYFYLKVNFSSLKVVRRKKIDTAQKHVSSHTVTQTCPPSWPWSNRHAFVWRSRRKMIRSGSWFH